MISAQRVFRRFLQATAAVPAVEQKRPGACGPASLRAVLLSYGKDVSEEELRKLSNSDEEGTTSEGIVQAAEAFGFKGKIKEKATFRELCDLVDEGTPIIVSWTSPVNRVDLHYSVISEANKESVVMMDPELGYPRKLSADDFQALWFCFENLKEQKGLHRHEIVVIRP